MSAVYLVEGARTPVGSFMGALSTVSSTDLGAIAIKATVNKAGVSGSDIDEVFMGQVIQAGVGQAPARQAAIKGGLPSSVPCSTINKVCGSGLKSVVMAVQSIQAGENKICLAGGMESMSQAPHLLPSSRSGLKFGATELKDSMQWDGLWDVYTDRPMGNCAEECVSKYQFTREELDAYAIESFKRAQRAQEEGVFASEITPVEVKNRESTLIVDQDEGPSKVRFDKVPLLRPAFDKSGKITAANSSTINDGAAAMLVVGEDFKCEKKFKVVAYASHAQEPTWFTTAPIESSKKCLDKAGLLIDQIDLFEINEAFSVVALAAIRELKLDQEKVNIFGSGISLGHPIGASGTRIVMSLMNGLERKKLRYGMASICIGGGEALSLIIEREG